jgi:Cd2+/Zn2+-exporting ATPase
MSETTLQLDIPMLLPEIEDSCDDCVTQLERVLKSRKGIHRVHVKREQEPTQLCLHFDPNLVSLTAVERMARDAGSHLTQRYRHERIPFTGMDVADAAESLARYLEKLPGMLHASINYAAGLAFVAYDTQELTQAQVEGAIGDLGYHVVREQAAEIAFPDEESRDEEGGALTFLPGWIRERRQLVMVALAGLFLLIGWLGETFLGMPENVSLVFYILSYIAGGYYIATHAIPGLFRGWFDTDVLMLAAAAGAAFLWPRPRR